MDSDQFRNFGKAVIDFIAEYTDHIRERPVLPDVEPGYLFKCIPDEAPKLGEDWKDVMRDFEKYILPGVTHWQSPNFHAFFPTASSFPAIVGELLCAGLGIVAFHWEASPACTELEVITMNWLGKMLNLPAHFLNSSEGPGGGAIQGSASEATLLCLLTAKLSAIAKLKPSYPHLTEEQIASKLVAYTSDQANSSVEKSSILGSVMMRILSADANGQLGKETFFTSVIEDIHQGLIPFCLIATSGTTGVCAFDPIHELGPICLKYNIWLHVDAAYAGSAYILPEYQHLAKGLEYADSFNFNPHKWLLVNFDCSALWVKDSNKLVEAFKVDRIYLECNNQSTRIPEYRNWQIPLGRKFRALKLWFTLRIYGIEGLQSHLRKQIELAKTFASLVEQDDRFEIVTPVSMGLVCFRMKGENELTQKLHEQLHQERKLYMIVAKVGSKLVLRFVVCSPLSQEFDIQNSWREIQRVANLLTPLPNKGVSK